MNPGDTGSGQEKSLGTIAWTASETWTGSATWTVDSRTVLTSNSSGIGSEIIAYPVSGDPPYSIYSTTVNVRHLAVGGNGLLAVETDPSRENLARASAKPIAQPDLIDPANGMTWSPSFAPDGTLAFLSIAPAPMHCGSCGRARRRCRFSMPVLLRCSARFSRPTVRNWRRS